MKNKILKKKNWKWIIGIVAGVILIGCLLFVFGEKDDIIAATDEVTETQVESTEAVQEAADDDSEEEIVDETEETESIETSQAEVIESEEDSSESENINEDNTNVEEEENTGSSVSEESVATIAEANIEYVPITAGWKAEDSAKGDITASQKADLDEMISLWKSGEVSDAELKTKIMNYLDEQGIEYMEVSVTSEGYALYDEIPEIDLRDGGNLYSYVGTYSTGEQNPDGTEKTVCYNWSAFVF